MNIHSELVLLTRLRGTESRPLENTALRAGGGGRRLQRLRLALSKGPNRAGVSPSHLKTETDPVSETFCFPVTASVV
jgi:hypothetical protein